MNKYLSKKLKVLSFVLILMVVFLHSYNISTYANDIEKLSNCGYNSFIQHLISGEITRIAVPLFFFISGYLFFLNVNGTKEAFLEKYKKRVKSLLIPYLFWSSIWIIIYFCLQSLPQTKSLFAGKPIKDFSFPELLDTLFLNPITFQFWFIKDLIIMVVLSPLLFWFIKKLKYFVVLLFLIAWYVDSSYHIIEASFFFATGASLTILKSNILKFQFGKKHIFWIILWLSIVFVNTILDYNNFQNKLLLDTLQKTGILIGIVSIWILYDLLSNKNNTVEGRFFEIYSFSFFIFAFHIPLMTFVRALLFKFGNSELISFSIYMIAPIIVISTSLLTAIFLKRVTPNFYKIINGGR